MGTTTIGVAALATVNLLIAQGAENDYEFRYSLTTAGGSGGGGGATENTRNTGAGGNGGNGVVVVISR